MDHNFASAQDLVDALDMSFIANLKRTRELAGKDTTLSKIRKALPGRHSPPSSSTGDCGALYSLGACADVHAQSVPPGHSPISSLLRN